MVCEMKYPKENCEQLGFDSQRDGYSIFFFLVKGMVTQLVKLLLFCLVLIFSAGIGFLKQVKSVQVGFVGNMIIIIIIIFS